MGELQRAIALIRANGAALGHSAELIRERERIAELLLVHVEAEWIDGKAWPRLLNFLASPDTWEEWKGRGGDPGLFGEFP